MLTNKFESYEEAEESLITEDDIFEDTTDVGEVPVLKEEVEFIATSENSIRRIEYTLESIFKQKGMTRALALESADLCPNIAQKNPNFFTIAPTNTLYQFSLESLYLAVKNFIIDIFKNLYRMLTKVFFWARRLWYKNVSDDYSEGKLSYQWDERVNLQIKLKSSLKASQRDLKTISSDSSLVKDIASNFKVSQSQVSKMTFETGVGHDSLIRKIIEGEDPLAYDLLEKGVYFKTLTSKLPEVSKLLSLMTSSLEELIKSTGNINKLISKNKDVKDRHMKKYDQDVNNVNVKFVEPLNKLTTEISTVRSNLPKATPIDLTKQLEIISNFDIRILEDIELQVNIYYGKVKNILENGIKEYGNLTSFEGATESATLMARKIREMGVLLIDIIKGYLKSFQEVTSYLKLYYVILNSLAQYSDLVIETITSKVVNSGTMTSDPENLITLAKNASERRKENVAMYRKVFG